MAILLTVAGAAVCYLLARQRFAAAPAAIATLGVAAGSGVLWYASGSDDPAATVRFAAGAIVAYGWVRASRGRSTRGQWAWATVGVALGLAAALAWREPLAFAGTLDLRRRPVVVEGRAAGHVAGGLRLGDRPVAAVPRRPRACGRRPGAAGAHDAARVGARLLVVVRVAGPGGVPGPDALLRLRGGGRGRRGREGRRAASRARRRRAAGAARGLEPHVDEGRRRRQLRPSTSRCRSATSAPRKPGPCTDGLAIRRRCRPISPTPWPTAFTHRPTT